MERELAEHRATIRLLRGQLTEREQEAHDLRRHNEELQAKLDALQHRIEGMNRRIYGASSERHHPGQQTIGLAAPVEIAEDAPTSHTPVTTTATSPAPAAATTPASTRRPRQPGRHPGRRRLPASAEVVETDLDVPASDRLDENGKPLPFLGWRVSEKWDYRPGAYLIRRFRRGIYGRPFSLAQDRIVAAMPACLIPRGAMTDAALIHTVVEKLVRRYFVWVGNCAEKSSFAPMRYIMSMKYPTLRYPRARLLADWKRLLYPSMIADVTSDSNHAMTPSQCS